MVLCSSYNFSFNLILWPKKFKYGRNIWLQSIETNSKKMEQLVKIVSTLRENPTILERNLYRSTCISNFIINFWQSVWRINLFFSCWEYFVEPFLTLEWYFVYMTGFSFFCIPLLFNSNCFCFTFLINLAGKPKRNHNLHAQELWGKCRWDKPQKFVPIFF